MNRPRMDRLFLDNKTRWRTTDLRSMILACEKWLGLHASRVVRIAHTRGHRTSGRGRASLGSKGGRHEGHNVSLWLPPPDRVTNYQVFFASAAWLVEHELAHNAGMSHGDMDRGSPLRTVHDAQEPPRWAAGLVLRERPAPKDAPSPAERTEARIAARAAKARLDLARWERRFRLAKTKVGKYKRQTVHYEKMLAPEAVAARSSRPPPPPRPPRPKRLVFDVNGGSYQDSHGVQRFWVHVGRAVWEEIGARILDMDFDASMADVQELKADLTMTGTPRANRSGATFAMREEHFPILARELRDMTGFVEAPAVALERAAARIHEFAVAVRASREAGRGSRVEGETT